MSNGIPRETSDERAASRARMPPVLREDLAEMIDDMATLPWLSASMGAPRGARPAILGADMAKSTESMPEGERQGWILAEPVVGVRIPGTRFEYLLEPKDEVIEIGSEPAPSMDNGRPVRRIVVPSPKVSRRHCTIERRNDRWIVFDADAKNGIFLGDQRRTTFELVPGLRFKVGPVPFVAYSAAGQRARLTMQRYFGLSDAQAVTVEGVLALANEQRHVVVQQPTGGGGVGVARAIHDASPRASWPFNMPGKLGDTRREQLATLNATAYGTLVLRVDQLPAHRDELLHTLATWQYNVRLVLLVPRGQRVASATGDEMLTASTIVTVPTIEERRAELVELVALLCQEAGLKLGLPGATLSPKVWTHIETHAWPENLEELERFVERVLAIGQHKGKLRPAAAALGVSAGAMIEWAERHKIKALLK